MNTIEQTPLPILLEDGSRYDWLDASYAPEVSVGRNSATVRHRLIGAPALHKLIEDGTAAWAVELRCPKTLMARVETSTSTDDPQVVSWAPDEVDDMVYIVPGLIARMHFSLDGTGLTSLWADADELRVPAGWWLAKGQACRSKTLTESLVTFRRNDDMDKGTMEVGPDYGGGRLRFTVKMAPDVFKQAKSDRTLQVAALVGVCGWFPRVFGGALSESRSESGTSDARDEEPLARELGNRLRQKRENVALWDDENYDPALVATLLEPFFFADSREDNDEED